MNPLKRLFSYTLRFKFSFFLSILGFIIEICSSTYGRKKLQFKKINKKFQKILADFDRQALHAKSLGFFHPTKDTFVNFDSKLPQDFKKMLDFLEKFGN